MNNGTRTFSSNKNLSKLLLWCNKPRISCDFKLRSLIFFSFLFLFIFSRAKNRLSFSGSKNFGNLFEIFPIFCLIILATTPLIIKSGQKLKQNYNELTNLIPVMSSTLSFSRITGALLVVGFLVSVI